MISTSFFDWRLGLIGSLTLGLAPFTPEPHILGKIKWVMGGADGMTGMDWADLLFHGAPWIYLGISLLLLIRKSSR